MKKLLTILGAVGLTATGTTSAVVSCGAKNTIVDLDSFDGKIAGADLTSTYGTVDNLKKGILFQLGITTSDLNSAGVQLWTGVDKAAAEAATQEASGNLIAGNSYVVSMTSNEPKTLTSSETKTTAIGAINKVLVIADLATKINLSNIKTPIDTEFSTTVAPANSTDPNSAIQASNQIVEAISSVTGVVNAQLISADFNPITDGENAIFNPADTNSLIVGSDGVATSTKPLSPKAEAVTFTGSIGKGMLEASSTSLDITSLVSASISITVTGDDNWNNNTLTSDGVKAANSEVIDKIKKLINNKISSPITIAPISNDPNITLLTGWTASTTQAGRQTINWFILNDVSGSEQLTGWINQSTLGITIVKG